MICKKGGLGVNVMIALVLAIAIIFIGTRLYGYSRDSATGTFELTRYHAKGILEEADQAFDDGEYEDAIELYEEFLEKFPTHKEAYRAQLRIGESYYKLEEWQLALNAYKKTNENYDLSSDLQKEVDNKIRELEAKLRTTGHGATRSF